MQHFGEGHLLRLFAPKNLLAEFSEERNKIDKRLRGLWATKKPRSEPGLGVSTGLQARRSQTSPPAHPLAPRKWLWTRCSCVLGPLSREERLTLAATRENPSACFRQCGCWRSRGRPAFSATDWNMLAGPTKNEAARRRKKLKRLKEY